MVLDVVLFGMFVTYFLKYFVEYLVPRGTGSRQWPSAGGRGSWQWLAAKVPEVPGSWQWPGACQPWGLGSWQ